MPPKLPLDPHTCLKVWWEVQIAHTQLPSVTRFTDDSNTEGMFCSFSYGSHLLYIQVLLLFAMIYDIVMFSI